MATIPIRGPAITSEMTTTTPVRPPRIIHHGCRAAGEAARGAGSRGGSRCPQRDTGEHEGEGRGFELADPLAEPPRIATCTAPITPAVSASAVEKPVEPTRGTLARTGSVAR